MTESIRPISICVFRDREQILVFEGTDPAKGSAFARPLGGGIEPGESSREALEREILEELSAEIVGLHLLGVLESIFEYKGEQKHEIVFVYDGRFCDKTLYERESLPMVEGNVNGVASWRPISYFDSSIRLVPDGLGQLLDNHRDA